MRTLPLHFEVCKSQVFKRVHARYALGLEKSCSSAHASGWRLHAGMHGSKNHAAVCAGIVMLRLMCAGDEVVQGYVASGSVHAVATGGVQSDAHSALQPHVRRGVCAVVRNPLFFASSLAAYQPSISNGRLSTRA